MSEFQREERYIVVKYKDLTTDQKLRLLQLLREAGIPTRESVVVEAYWPNYEHVWRTVEWVVNGMWPLSSISEYQRENAALEQENKHLRAELDQLKQGRGEPPGIRPMKPVADYMDEGEFLVYAKRAGMEGWIVVHFAQSDGEGFQPPFGPGLFYWTGCGFTELSTKDCLGWLPLSDLSPPAPAAVPEGYRAVPIEFIEVLQNSPELNLSNYDHNEVCELNAAVCEALSILTTPQPGDKQ